MLLLLEASIGDFAICCGMTEGIVNVLYTGLLL